MKIFDIETFSNCIVIVFKTLNKNIYDVFVTSNIDIKNIKVPKCTIYDIKDLKKYIKENNQIIGYNNQSFDNQILELILRGTHYSERIYEYAQRIILERLRPEFSDKKLSFKYLDLLKINHYDNPARMTSLKKLEFNYRKKRIMDLPFHHSMSVTKESELVEIIRYCCYDTDVTEDCFNKSMKAIKLRQDLNNHYSSIYLGFDCMNYSDVKIGEELNLRSYCRLANKEINDVKYNIPSYPNLEIKFAECIPDYIQFKTKELKDFLEELKKISTFKTKGFQKKLYFHGNEITYGQGGIHNVCNPRLIKSNDKFIIKSVDVGSQYPSNIIKRRLYPRHLGKEWVENIEATYLERITKHKPNAKKSELSAALSEICKLQMNGGGYGKTNSEFSWQYDPLVTMSVTLTCQLELLMLVEEMVINGFKLLILNTDGAEFYVDREKEDLFNEICKNWEEKTKNTEYGRLEFVEYEFIAQTSVNDYIAKYTTGEVKRKGLFMTYEDIKKDNWHKDSSGNVIAIALEKYFIENIPIEDTINSCNNIYDFCYGVKKQKTPKKGEFKWLISEVDENNMVKSYLSEDRFIRYYIGGNTTINMLYQDGEIKNLPTKNNTVTVAQYIRREEIVKDGDAHFKTLDKNFYIEECKEIINSIINE